MGNHQRGPCKVFGGREKGCAKACACLLQEGGLGRQCLKLLHVEGCSLFSPRFPLGSQPTSLPSCPRTWLPSVLD